MRRRSSASRSCSSASRASSPGASGSGSRSGARSCATLRCSSSTSRSPTWTPSSAKRNTGGWRTIARHPQVFLFDEPLSNLDAKLRVQMRVELKRLHERLETTAIYVTHDQVEAMTLGDRVVVMKDGTVQQVGEPLELYGK